MAIEKNSGDQHPPEVERDLPVQGASEDGAQARHLEESREQGVRKAGILSDGEQDGGDKPDKPANTR